MKKSFLGLWIEGGGGLNKGFVIRVEYVESGLAIRSWGVGEAGEGGIEGVEVNAKGLIILTRD